MIGYMIIASAPIVAIIVIIITLKEFHKLQEEYFNLYKRYERQVIFHEEFKKNLIKIQEESKEKAH